jgi:DNA-binding transcriptional MerR regulator
MLSIGALSKRTGVKVPTIRYYEEIGLIDAPERSHGNQRRYGTDAVHRLAFIRHGRELGFSLDAIRDLLMLSRHPDRPCADADRLAEEQLHAVEARIERLTRLKRELERMIEGCRGGTVADCRVLESLADHALCETRH